MCRTDTNNIQKHTNNVKHKIKDVDKHVPKNTSDEKIDFKTNGSRRRPGILQPIAASMLMQLFYATRVARPEFLKCVGFLAKRVNVNRWGDKCDERLHKLMCNVLATKDDQLIGRILTYQTKNLYRH